MQRTTEIPTIDVNLVSIEHEGTEIGLTTASQISVTVQTETTDAVQLIVKGVLKAQKSKETTVTGNQITLKDNVFSPELVEILQGGTITKEQQYTYSVEEVLTAGSYCVQLATDKYLNFTLDEDVEVGSKLSYSTFTKELIIEEGATITKVDATVSKEAFGSTLSISPTETDRIVSYAPPVSGSKEDKKVFTLKAYSAVYDSSGVILYYECIEYPNCQGEPVAFSSEDNVFRAPSYVINSAPSKGQSPYVISYVPTLPQLN